MVNVIPVDQTLYPQVNKQNIIDGNLQTDSIEDIFGRVNEMVPIFTTKKPEIFSNEKQSPVELIDEIFDDDVNDEEGTLQCSNFFERGFSCVSKESCSTSQIGSNDIIILKEETLEDSEEILRDELFERAQCPENGMVCCYNENILQMEKL